MNLFNLLKEKYRHSIWIIIVSLLLSALLLPPVSTVRADDDEFVFPNFEEADCQCPALISKFDMKLHRIYYDQDSMEVWFKLEREGQSNAFLRQSTTWCSSPQACQDARDSWFDTTRDNVSWIEDLQYAKEGIERGVVSKIVELDEDIKDSRVSLVYIDRSRCSGSRKFTYEDTFSVSITFDGFRDAQILIDAMNELESCIRDVLKRKMQEMAAGGSGEGGATETSVSIEDAPETSAQPKAMALVRSVSNYGVRKVEIRRAGTDIWKPVNTGMYILEGDELRTLYGGHCVIGSGEHVQMRPGRIIFMETDSHLRMPTMEEKNRPPYYSWEAFKGRLYLRMKELYEEIIEGKVKIKTPNAIGGITGTEFEIIIEEDGTSTFNVLEGVVEVSDLNETRTVTVNAGETTVCKPGGLPAEPQSIDVNSLEKWWEDIPLEDEISEGESGFNVMFIIIPVVLIAAIAVGVIIFLKRRK